jgi:hypothetical protein
MCIIYCVANTDLICDYTVPRIDLGLEHWEDHFPINGFLVVIE